MTESYGDASGADPGRELPEQSVAGGAEASGGAGQGAQERVAALPRLTAAQAAALRGARNLLIQLERADLEQLVAERLRMHSGPPQVVLVGEAKSGKSSLVNALLSRPGLAPVGLDVTTRCVLRFLPADEPENPVRATVLFSDGRVQRVEPGELSAWAIGAVTPADDGISVLGIDVPIVEASVGGAVLVDTPGAGGLEGGHARLALLAAQRAGVLVFVTDAGQPLAAPETDFLRAAAETVDSVVVAVTKVDKYPQGFAEVIEENRALLREHAPRFADAPLVGVSSDEALQALGMPKHDAAEARAISGVPALAALIEERVMRREEIYVRNALRTASSVLAQLAGDLGARLDAARQEPGSADRAAAERDQLRDLRDQEARWSLNLERDLRRKRKDAVDLLTDETERLRVEWRERVEEQRAGFRAAVAEELTVRLRADVAELLDQVARRLQEGVEEVVTALLEREVASTLLAGLDPGARHPDAAKAPSGVKELVDPTLITTASVGAGVGGQWLGSVIVLWQPWLIPVVAGVAFLGLTTYYKQRQQARKRLAEWVIEEIVRARNHAITQIDHVISELKPEIVTAFRALLTARIQALQAVVAEADAAKRSDAGARRQRVTALETHIAAVEARRAEVDALVVGGGTP